MFGPKEMSKQKKTDSEQLKRKKNEHEHQVPNTLLYLVLGKICRFANACNRGR